MKKIIFNKQLPDNLKRREFIYNMNEQIIFLMDEYNLEFGCLKENLEKFNVNISKVDNSVLNEIVSEEEVLQIYEMINPFNDNKYSLNIKTIKLEDIQQEVYNLINVNENFQLIIDREILTEQIVQTQASLMQTSVASNIINTMISKILDKFDKCKNLCQSRFKNEKNEKLRTQQTDLCECGCNLDNYQATKDILIKKKNESCSKKHNPVECMQKMDDKIQILNEKIKTENLKKQQLNEVIKNINQSEVSE